jgi:hypothetical protein
VRLRDQMGIMPDSRSITQFLCPNLSETLSRVRICCEIRAVKCADHNFPKM